ncbi:MAG: hypothetical protein K0S12_787 [Bacteroidetes bacterium]|nr:hypothetical protein [Bacteroidota bacterium]
MIVGYAGLSCVCNDTAFSASLVAKSGLIFEGKLISIDQVAPDVNGDNLLLKFYPVIIHKGKISDTVFLRSNQGACGFIERFHTGDEYVGNRYLIYSTKVNGQFGYNPCNNRRVLRRPFNPDPQSDSASENLNAETKKYDSLYISELVKLGVMLRK